MYTKFSDFLHNKFYIELSIASVLFIIALFTDMLMTFIIYMLYFIIFLEIVRAVMNYIREQKVHMKFLIDAFIILVLRELIVNVVKINTLEIHSFTELFNHPTNYNLLVLSGVLVFLYFLRYLSIVTATNNICRNYKSENQ